MRNWEAEYQALLAGKKMSASYTLVGLYEMASELAVAGNYEAKRRIYDDFILAHPDASDDDRTRVLIYRADLTRRGDPKTRMAGDPERALQMLCEIEEPADPLARIDFLQAQSECYIVIGDLEKALELKLQIMKVCDRTKAVPLDKRLYYKSGVIRLRISLEGGSERVMNELECYRELLNDPALEGNSKQYALAEYYDRSARVFQMTGDVARALENFKRYFDISVAPATKAVAALKYLNVVWHADPADRDPITIEMLGFFQSHENETFPTYIKSYQSEYVFVQSIVSKIE